jgi:hypothetical protein
MPLSNKAHSVPFSVKNSMMPDDLIQKVTTSNYGIAKVR